MATSDFGSPEGHMALPRPKSYISIGCHPLVHPRRSNMISEGNTAASTQFPEVVSGNENTSGLPNQSEVPPDQRLGSEAPPDVPMDPEAPMVPPLDSEAPVPPADSKSVPAPMDSEMAPEPMESLDHVQSGAFDGDLSDLTPLSSPQREDSVTGGMQTPLGHDKLGKLDLITINYISQILL